MSSTAGSSHPKTNNPASLHSADCLNNAPVQPTQQSRLISDPQAASDVSHFPTYAELLNSLSILLREKYDLQAQLSSEQKETGSLRERVTSLQTYCNQVEEQLKLERYALKPLPACHSFQLFDFIREATWNVDQRLDSLLKLTESHYKRPLKRARVV
jgi:hypothetical protein